MKRFPIVSFIRKGILICASVFAIFSVIAFTVCIDELRKIT